MMSLEQAKLRYPPIWTIYERPSDFPSHYVVRVWYGMVPEPKPQLRDNLDQARAWAISQGASTPLQRDTRDDPCIVESWI